ncbi:MAG: glycerate kinase [candidate division KSB1 bacterium]|nr:glycerate kinase [candidate division KSB1 bacterium]MDZ7318958.1 glycerate kinase [candidate division KSB1 bacterium]MDZ7341371.1 glycerate kinase [candidate division KSB1 bacterium]
MNHSDLLPQMRQDAQTIFQASLRAVDPVEAVKRFLVLRGDTLYVTQQSFPLAKFKGIYLVGFGKAGASMARGVEAVLGDRLQAGIINVKYGHLQKLSSKIKINEAGHPVPDAAGMTGSQEIVHFLESRGADDLVICVISGGGSAIFPLPQEGITLAEKQEVTRQLLACGADIKEINAIRKHISRVKGGQLARIVQPATLITLILSDVIGDPLDSIASGPTAPDSTTFQDCMNILNKYQLWGKIPRSIEQHIRAGADGRIPDTPKVGDPAFATTHNVIVGSNWQAVQAAQQVAVSRGYQTLILSTFIEGETRDVARVHAAIAKEVRKTGNPIAAPACILSGGETTVTIRGSGLGGRNQEFVLAAAIDLQGMPNVVVLSAGTDGTDGPTDAAGAIADGETISRGLKLSLKASDFLINNDSYHFFESLGDLIKTGPTNTNVMDLRIILIR